MNAYIVSVISMGVSIAALMLVLYRGLRADMAGLRADIVQQRNAISALGTQIRQEMSELRQEEWKQDISKLGSASASCGEKPNRTDKISREI